MQPTDLHNAQKTFDQTLERLAKKQQQLLKTYEERLKQDAIERVKKKIDYGD